MSLPTTLPLPPTRPAAARTSQISQLRAGKLAVIARPGILSSALRSVCSVNTQMWNYQTHHWTGLRVLDQSVLWPGWSRTFYSLSRTHFYLEEKSLPAIPGWYRVGVVGGECGVVFMSRAGLLSPTVAQSHPALPALPQSGPAETVWGSHSSFDTRMLVWRGYDGVWLTPTGHVTS